MFGYSAIPVINQKNAPAIWESSFATFPPQFILGRILIDTDNGAIYLDGSSSRTLLIAGNLGSIENGNATNVSSTPGVTKINLGGNLDSPTAIDLDTHDIFFNGSATNFVINPDGTISDDNSSTTYLPSVVAPLAAVVPTNTIEFYDFTTNKFYRVLCERI